VLIEARAEGLPYVDEITTDPDNMRGRGRDVTAWATSAGHDQSPNTPFAISELAVALRPDRDRHVLLAAGASLYAALADFALRATDRWSASGKALPRALTTMDPALANRFETAFTTLFAVGDVAPVQALVDTVLAPHGGRLREGYLLRAAAEWREG
jgi:hypothetical protein